MMTYGISSSSNPTRMVPFITSDRKVVKVPVAIAREFGTVRGFFDGYLDGPEVESADPFPLLNVDCKVFERTIDYSLKSLPLRWKIEALEKERLVELPSKYQALKKKRQEFVAEFFGRQSDEMIVKLIKAGDYLEYEELLDSVMPSFRKRFGLGDDKGVDFVYTAEADAILLRRAGDDRQANMATYGGSSSSNPSRMVTFITSDRKEVKVPVEIAREFGTVTKLFFGDLDSSEVENAAPFPLLNVDCKVFERIISFAVNSLYHRSTYQALEKERLFELPSKCQALEEERQEFVADFFGRQSDEMIVKLVKAADYLEYEEPLDSVMPSFRKRFGLGDDKGVDFVYTAEADAILHRRAGSRRRRRGSTDLDNMVESKKQKKSCCLD